VARPSLPSISKPVHNAGDRIGAILPAIEGDRVQLQQVALNLIVNAVQAMGAVEEGPRELFVTTARAEPDGVLVAVKDSGAGVAPANLERLFTPFYTTKPGGVGMGLSICRSIIEAHGDRLWVTATSPGVPLLTSRCPPTRPTRRESATVTASLRNSASLLEPPDIRLHLPSWNSETWQ
jgi:signal transduction histidine kinase